MFSRASVAVAACADLVVERTVDLEEERILCQIFEKMFSGKGGKG